VGADGGLHAKSRPTIASGSDPREVAVTPNGKSAYVTNSSSDDVSQYDIGAGGALTPKTQATVAAGDFPFGVVVSPDGASVYVANSASNTLSQYDVGAGGALHVKSLPAVTTGVGPHHIALSPERRVPASKQQCKHGGWKQFGFKNQGQCIRFVKHELRE
jgi:DNA-binding beta-propeller fold protein YncE